VDTTPPDTTPPDTTPVDTTPSDTTPVDTTPPDTTPTDTGPADTITVRVATFNVRLFFDDVCDSSSCGPGDFEQAPSTDAFLARADELAVSIERIDADVVLLQEVEKQPCLEAIQAALSVPYDIARIGEIGGSATIDTAVLARGELLGVRGYRSTPILERDGTTTSFTRELLELRTRIDGAEVVVYSAHFKAKVNDDPERRWAEANASRQIVEAASRLYPDALIVLGGDLNDTPGSDPILALESTGSVSRVASELTGSAAYTSSYRGAGIIIDHLYLSTLAGGAYLPGTAEVLRDAGSGLGGGLGGSDHAAVRATFAVLP
jgi:endonuclease/exonuclease/phosphatase family metal-dependent hydrolase